MSLYYWGETCTFNSFVGSAWLEPACPCPLRGGSQKTNEICRNTVTVVFTHFALYYKSDYFSMQLNHSGSKLIVTGTDYC